MKQFLSFSGIDVISLVKEALFLKKNPFLFKHIGKNKTIGFVFFNASLRTRLSSQKAALYLGCETWILNIDKDSWKIEMSDGGVMKKTQEHIKEAIGVMSLYCDILAVRIFPNLKDKRYDFHESLLKKIQYYSSVPVVSLESATLHPLQSLADAMTIEEFKPKKERVKVVLSWAPHPISLPQSVPNSFAQCISKLGYTDLVITHPKGYELDDNFINGAHIFYNQNEALKGADFIYAKNWSSFKNYGEIFSMDPKWTIATEKISNHPKFMHCLPVRRNLIVEDAVLDASLVYHEAENRIFSNQAVFKTLLKNL
ncbi:putative ornithine carbamoyltransferase [Candidatus Uzinura diaspidicola str. ASNER]|uniref:N-succinylornithine carbamoyltransferase n=1 Tax=Candidatus Uzinura diaspidicola str. ASNER TaxID=1133592 RepID=L7VJZ7_9FLAO|nr:putative ornithine carbamoyltransferase [Candidatus Uzinura diaspidicola str. ASNER]